MPQHSVYGEFVDAIGAIKTVVTTGGEINRKQRKRIRDVIGELADELVRAIKITITYLEALKSQRRKKSELVHLLRDAEIQIGGTFSAFGVCSGITDLTDEFSQWFNSVKLAIRVGRRRTIQRSINSLKDGEWAVIRDLQSTARRLRREASKIESAHLKSDYYNQHNKLTAYLDRKIRHYEKTVDSIQNATLDLMQAM